MKITKILCVALIAMLTLCMVAMPAYASTMPVVQGDLETLAAEGGEAAFDGETLGDEVVAEVVTGEAVALDEDAVVAVEEDDGGMTEEEKNAKLELGFYPDRFAQSLLVMVMGLVGIFAVTCIIILCMKILNKTTAEKK